MPRFPSPRETEVRREVERRDTMSLADEFERTMGDVVTGVVSASTCGCRVDHVRGDHPRPGVAVGSRRRSPIEAAANVETVAFGGGGGAGVLDQRDRCQVDEFVYVALIAFGRDAEATAAKVRELRCPRSGSVRSSTSSTTSRQTTCFALNATIEVARAPARGR